MCEWLSSRDWCDVQLICGDRSFSVHRSVLASVSNFLKRVLLSCPVDELPLLIFLPEFDHDAMASVLQYIYSGEVAVPSHKLDRFFDTIEAMEIYMDQRYKPDSSGRSKSVIQKSNICQPTQCQNQHGCMNVKTGMNIENFLCQIQDSLQNSTLRGEIPLNRRWSYENIPDMNNLISQTTRNGNGNGMKSGVLAILNKHYRAPTSVLLTNANGKHPSASDTLSDTSKRTTLRNSHITSIFDSFKQLQHIPDNEKRNKTNDRHEHNISNKLKHKNYNMDYTFRRKSKDLNEINVSKSNTTSVSSQFLSINPSLKSFSEQRWSLNLNHRKDISYFNPEMEPGFDFSVVKHSCKIFDQDKFKHEYKMKESKDTDSETRERFRAITKVTILNKVFQSPWHPRLPDCYKPFRKKVASLIEPHRNNKNTVIREQFNGNNNEDTQSVILADKETSFQKTEYKCAICQQIFTSSYGYNVHMRRHSSIGRYSCEECHKSFSQLRNFKYHMSIHRGTKEFAATCPVCGKYFNDRGYLSSHMKIHKNRKEYKCPSCPKSFNQRVAYNMHVRIHTGVKPHVCEECGKAFSRKMLLKQHQRTHSGERPYACAHCDKRFADRSNMTLHLRLHTGVKPFSCSLCSKSFTKKHHLKAHLNFHTGAKPYSCPRCKLAFTQSSNMRTHYKKCSATEPAINGD